MSGPESKRAAGTWGGWIEPPPLPRTRFNEILGHQFSDQAWREIEKSYQDFSFSKGILELPKVNRNRKDEGSWFSQQESVSKDLERVNTLLERQLSNRRDFIRNVESTLVMSGVEAPNLYIMLQQAADAVLIVLTMVERAAPHPMEVASEPALRATLARSILDTIRRDGGPDRVSDGRLTDEAAECDLSPFEQLVSECGIHIAETPNALSRWVRRACGQN